MSDDELRAPQEKAVLGIATGVLVFLGLVFPLLFFITPVPVAILVYRQGQRSGIITAITVALVAGILIRPDVMIELLFILALGFSLGIALKEKFSAAWILVAGTGVMLVSMVLYVTFVRYAFGADLVAGFREVIRAVVDQVVNTLGAPPDMNGDEVKQRVVDSIVRVAPAMMVWSALLTAFLNFALSRWGLVRLGEKVEWFPPFHRWRLPWYMAWGYIIGRAILLAAGHETSGLIVTAGLNVDFVFSQLFLVQGFSLGWFFVKNWKVPVVLRALTLFFVLAFVEQIVVAIFPQILQIFRYGFPMTTLAGLLDTWFDFRKLGRR